MAPELVTERLLLRAWRPEDAESALRVYGDPAVVRWLSPAMARVADLEAMRHVLAAWIEEDLGLVPPLGRWAVERQADRRLVGGIVVLPLPPGEEDLEIGWQLDRRDWGHGYASEAGRAVARYAFEQGFDEVFAVVRPANARARATARRIGMEWVGETSKYYGLRLDVMRLRAAELA